MTPLRTTLRLLAAAALAGGPPLSHLSAQTGQPSSSPGIDVSGMDRSVKPGDDFFDYANGTWLKNTEIPPDKSNYGAGAILNDQTDKRVADLIQQVAKGSAPANSERSKIGLYYTTFMDTVAIEKAGLKPLRATLDSISAISDRRQLAQFLGSTLRADVDALNSTNFYTENLLGLWVAQDLDDPTQYSPFLLQGGLGMPDRSYYVDTSAAMAEIRAKYQQHVAALLKLAGITDGAGKAERIVQLRTRSRQAHWSREASGDVSKANNHWSRAEFSSQGAWPRLECVLRRGGLGPAPRFTVWQPSAITGISALAASEPIETWKDYLTFHAIQSRVRRAALGALSPERSPSSARC